MTISFNKFNSFVEALAEKVHNLGSDTLKVALSNSAPSASNTQLSNITEISYTNLSSRTMTVTGSAQSGGTYKLTLQDASLVASGDVATFRYIILYNDTATNDELIGYYDHGASVTMHNGDSFVLNFDDAAGVLTIA